MTVETGGPLRGLSARWLMRIEAAEGILRSAFLAITAASTLTSALTLMGAEQYAPWLLGSGLVGTPIFAYLYVEGGIFNRKNRERVDRGDNFVGPGATINAMIQARQLATLGETVRNGHDAEEIEDEMMQRTGDLLRQLRDGVDLQEVYHDGE